MEDLIIHNKETTLHLTENAQSRSLLLKLSDLTDGSTVCYSFNRSQILLLKNYLDDKYRHFTNNHTAHVKG